MLFEIVIGIVVIVSTVSYFLNSWTLYKPKSELEPGIYLFQEYQKLHCPKCNADWSYKIGYTYCDCQEYHEDHFHLQCLGDMGIDRKKVGCRFKWIMRTKQ